MENRVYGQILLSIPRHLLKVSIIVIIGSFLTMLFLLTNEKTLNDFISSEEVLDFTKHSIHPLFAHLQRTLDPDVKYMI